jgi:hypothetical protein
MHRRSAAPIAARFLLVSPLVVGSMTAVWPALSQAQPKPPSEAAARSEAERLGKEGERLLGLHDAGGAIAPLSRAYSLSSNPRFLLPLGLAYAEAERPLDALEALGHFLKDAPAIPDAKRKEIGSRFAVMLDQVAALVTLEASRQNALVKVDGRPIGTTPIAAPLRLLPGKHEIIMQPAPTDPSSGARLQIDVRPGERRTVKLEAGAPSRFLEPQAQADSPSGPDAEPAKSDATAASKPPAAIAAEDQPIYRKWWFWTAVGGGAAVLAVGLGAGLGARNSQSSDAFPAVPSWPGGPIDARSSSLFTIARLPL